MISRASSGDQRSRNSSLASSGRRGQHLHVGQLDLDPRLFQPGLLVFSRSGYRRSCWFLMKARISPRLGRNLAIQPHRCSRNRGYCHPVPAIYAAMAGKLPTGKRRGSGRSGNRAGFTLQVSRWVRFVRAQGRCEHCGRPHGQVVRHLGDGRWWDEARRAWRDGRGRAVPCLAPAEQPPVRTTRVVLAAAHLDHDPGHCGRRHRNVRALCQRCHLLHDRPEHRRRIRLTLRRRRALGDLFSGPYPAPVIMGTERVRHGPAEGASLTRRAEARSAPPVVDGR